MRQLRFPSLFTASHGIGAAGDDSVPGYYSAGVRIYTSGIAAVAPKLSLELHRAASEGNTAELNGLMQRYFLSAVLPCARGEGDVKLL